MDNRSTIVRRTIVESENIDNLEFSDFMNSIDINFKETLIVCFYGEDRESQHTLQTFVNMADVTEGIKFAVCNLELENKILKRFEELDDEDNPYYWARYTKVPFILTYRSGFPQAFYNNSIELNLLKSYSENLAHIKGYKEQYSAASKINYDKNIYLRTTYE